MRRVLPLLLCLLLLAVGTVPMITVYVSSQGVQATVSGATSIEADAIYTAEQIEPGVVVLSFERAPTWIVARAADGRETRWADSGGPPAPTPLPQPVTARVVLPVVLHGASGAGELPVVRYLPQVAR